MCVCVLRVHVRERWHVSQPVRAMSLRNTNERTVAASAWRDGVVRELLWVVITDFERPSTDQVKEEKKGIPDRGSGMSKEEEA